ncbi:class I SAM-dependent methyltransferase [Coraliomargarita akajimensis]|uniref:Methyltransferase n=1 Tax=Coraliomargarita akajimensis (strain DSM 45221 / IAM 15411 / JCM 23193 / KCTC 12865 / 04OKA010-24) TaxID=583355 RepID=D5EPB7_CORAD|nr:class I SAM-dependent methyltransferase [Coraliomargarita akajimensis]ADE55627.1 hypothetical protein Caka_2611 [Coraliomargarita akajimensis DSM 45221]
MPYEQIPYEVEDIQLPEKVASFIQEADKRCDAYYAAELNKRYPKYVPSEPAQVYAALKFVTDQGLPLGEHFIEWGSGFGVATGLAALLDYTATGIEIQEDLIEKAERLLSEQGVDAQFINCSYIPEGLIEYETLGTTDLEFDSYGQTDNPIYEEMEIPINEIDLFFAYPWPGEQGMMLKLFDLLAGDGAILVTYFGDREINIYRKL